MKIAFCILAHKHPEQLRRLVHTLDDPRFDFFIHLDAKADASLFRFDSYSLKHSRLTVLEKRVTCLWGDISLVKAELSLYRTALSTGNYTRFITLSGNDFPIHSNDRIYRQLTASQEESIVIQPLQKNGFRRVQNYYFWTIPSHFSFRLIKKLLKTLHLYKKAYLTVDNQIWQIYESSQWHGLTQDCVKYILDRSEKHPEIESYFRYSYAPDELFIPTLIGNCPEFKSRTTCIDSLTPISFDDLAAIHYVRHKPNEYGTVKVLTEEDYPQLLSSGKLFARKLIPGKSDGLAERLSEFRIP